MKTWFNLIPYYFFPFLLTFFPALMPQLPFVSIDIGHRVRVFFVDHMVLPILSDAAAWTFAAWYQTASELKAVLLHLLVSLNITFIAGVVIFIFGTVYLQSHNFLVLSKIKKEEDEANR